MVFWYLWIGRAKNPGPGSSHHLAVEVFDVGGWLTHGDLALDAGLDFLAVTEHRLISARVRSEWARSRAKGVASIWGPASQDASHVGNAGVGVVSLRGAPLTLPTCATAQFKGFFDCGRVRCTFPLGAGRFMHLVVLYVIRGTASDPGQLALTDQLFDAALAELSVVARVSIPCMLVGDFNVEPTKIPCLAKGISAGLWVDLEGCWALATGRQPSSTCMREWVLVVVFVVILWLGALFLLLLYCLARFRLTGGLRLVLLFGPSLTMSVGLVVLLSRFDFLLSGLPLGYKVRRVWEIYDDRLQFMSRQDAFLLNESSDVGDVSQAWLVWSRAPETALADAHCFSGGPAPCQGLVLGRGFALFRHVRLGGYKVRKVRCNAVDVHDAADISLYRDPSISPWLDMRRRFKAVMDVLSAMIRNGVSHARSVELTAQWDRILAIGPLHPVTIGDLDMVRVVGVGV